MANVRQSIAFSFAGKYASLFIQFFSIIVVSRILTPEELGIYSLASSSIVIGQMLRDFGLSMYLIQEEHLNKQKIQACFTISLCLCWTIAVIYYFSSGFIANYFDKSEIELLVKLLAINFLIIPFGTFTLTLLKRNMQFDKIMIIDTISNSIAAIATITLVSMDYGLIALAYASILGTLSTALMTFFYTDFSHFSLTFKNISSIVSFSSMVSLTNILDQVKKTLPEFVIGKQISADYVAYYNKASSTASLFARLLLQSIAPAIQPYMAKLKRDKENLSAPILTVFSYIQVLSFPFYGFLFFYSEEVIRLLYGSQWGEVPALLEIVCISTSILYILPIADQILLALGEAKFVLNMNLVLVGLRVIYLVIFVALDLSVLQLLIMFATAPVLRCVLLMRKLKSQLNIDYRSVIFVTLQNLRIAAILLILFYAEKHLSIFGDDLMTKMVVVALSGLLLWLFLVVVFRHPICQEMKRVFEWTKNRIA